MSNSDCAFERLRELKPRGLVGISLSDMLDENREYPFFIFYTNGNYRSEHTTSKNFLNLSRMMKNIRVEYFSLEIKGKVLGLANHVYCPSLNGICPDSYSLLEPSKIKSALVHSVYLGKEEIYNALYSISHLDKYSEIFKSPYRKISSTRMMKKRIEDELVLPIVRDSKERYW